MTPQNQVQKTDPKFIEYVPFGAADKIKLSVEIVQNIIAVQTRSGKTCGQRDAMKFIMLCLAQRLNPFAGDAYLLGYDGKNGPVFSLITAHVAFLKRAESSLDFEGMESGVILQTADGVTEREGDFHVAEEKVVGGWARVYRKNRKPTYRRLSIEQRKPMYETPFWSKDKEAEQIVKCAEADALRSTFPTLLGGLHMHGEIVNIESSATTAVADLTSQRLVAVKSSEAAPAQETGQPAAVETAPTAKITEQEELAEIVTGAGFGFDQFQKWAAREGQLPDATSIASFDEVPTAIAKRLVAAKVGLLKGLGQEGGDK